MTEFNSLIYVSMNWITIASHTDPFHKSHNALGGYLTMDHFVTEMCTHVHISVTKWCLAVYGTDASLDLCNKFISFPHVPQQAIDIIDTNLLSLGTLRNLNH